MSYKRTLGVILLLVAFFSAPLPGMAQENESYPSSPVFSKEQLAQMLAPVALYPDTLLSQILMASTYPLEVVEADRWVKQNPGLSGSALDEAVKDEDWDASVQALCHVPSVLGWMSENIAQTSKLGDAFLAQENDVMNMVQELRKKAMDNGTLKSTAEQKVTVLDDTIIIEPVQPEIVYVPSYDPLYVYGPWWYPAYPPYYWGPVLVVGGFTFWPGIYVGIDIGYWCYFDWPRHRIHVDINRKHHFYRGPHPVREFDRWRHEPEHRRGVAYRHKETARKFGQSPVRIRETGRDVRGFPDSGRPLRQQPAAEKGEDRQRRGDDGGASIRVVPGSKGAESRGAVRGAVRRDGTVRERERNGAFDRVDEGRRERTSGERGRTSREQQRLHMQPVVPRGGGVTAPAVPAVPRSGGVHVPAAPSAPKSGGAHPPVTAPPKQDKGDRHDRK